MGVQLVGRGAVTIDSVSADFDNEQAVRALIRRFAESRNAFDIDALKETYAEDAEYRSAWGHSIRGRANLAEMWRSVTGQAQRTIESVEMLTPDIASVRVRAEFPPPVPVLNEVFIVVREEGQWRTQLP